MTVGQECPSVAGLGDVTALLERQRGLLRAAMQLGVEVEGVIARGDTDALTQAIDRRGELIEELRGLDPQVRAAGEWLAGASQVVREHVVQMAQEVARLRERVLEQVRGQEQAVRATKAKLASEAGKLVAIGSALQAYRTTRTVAARFTDSRG